MDVINTLDGFNLQPRLSIPFDGPIDVDTATSETVFLISLGSTTSRGDRGGKVIGINQIVWDTLTTSLYVESDEFLAQHTRYALIVTRGIRDDAGAPVHATQAFRRFRHTVREPYKQALLDAIHAARRLGVREEDIAVASVFTTQSVTAILEKIRDQIKGETPEPADFLLGPDKTRTVFPLDAVTGIRWNQQIGDNPPRFSDVPVDISLIGIIPGAVGQVAFGRYLSPDYEVHPGEFIPSVGTRTGTPEPQETNDIYFNLFLPSSPMPAGGWPVAIHGHGAAGSKQRDLFVVATLAEHGIATIVINKVGRGFGPLGTLTVKQSGGKSVTFSAGGRGFDQNGDRNIGPTEGEIARPPRTIIFNRDAQRQTVVDFMQLVRVIQVGMDVDGDAVADLDPSRIYYFGWSFGGNNGTTFLALEPSVRAGALYCLGGPIIENRRLGVATRSAIGTSLASRTPSLLNSPGITNLGGLMVPPQHFNENMPLRDGVPLALGLANGTSYEIRSPVINMVPGAIEIQHAIEDLEWVSQSGNQVAYMPHLRKDPLAGVPAKSVLVLFARGDTQAANPNVTAMLRAGELADHANTTWKGR